MDRINHHHLYIFWTLARQGTFTRAAEALHISQSAVTAQIKDLEQQLGLELVDRSNRRKPTLTEEGGRVLEFADSIFESAAELIRWAKHNEPVKNQRLRVGALSGLSRNLQYEFLKPIVGRNDVTIEFTTGDQEKLVRLLREHSLDVILSSHNVAAEGRSQFHSHVLTRSPLVFVVERGRGRPPTLAQALTERPLYVPGAGFEARPELNAYLDGLKVPIRLAGEIDDIALLRIFALRSRGIVALPEMGVVNDIRDKTLLVLGRAGRIEQRFYAVTRQRKFPNRHIENLIAQIRVLSI